MERSSPVPRGAIRPDDLVELSARPGPFASVWTTLSGTGGWGTAEDARRRKNILAELGRVGAPDQVASNIDDALGTVDAGAGGAVAVADPSGVVIIEPLPEAPRADVVRWGPRPSVSPVLEHRQAAIPAVVVLADRLGADLAAGHFGHEMRDVTVDGSDDPIRKTGQGGWSQARYQTRAEQTWEQNAREVVAEIERLAGQIDPVTILIGGDVRAVELIVDALPETHRSLVRHLDHGRAADSSGDLRDHEIRTMLRTAVAAQTVALLETFEARSQRDGTAASGPDATIAAIRQAQVEVLMVHDDPDDERNVFVSPESPVAIAATADELLASGLGVASQARLVDAAIGSVLQSGGSVRIVPAAESLHGGIGALLRWETPNSTRHAAA
jgi:hypothetical protein